MYENLFMCSALGSSVGKHSLLCVWHTLTSFSELQGWSLLTESEPRNPSGSGHVPFSLSQRTAEHSNNGARLPTRPFSLQKQVSDDHQF